MEKIIMTIDGKDVKGKEYPSMGLWAGFMTSPQLVPFYRDSWRDLSESGIVSLTKMLGIPTTYFNGLPFTLREQLIANGAAELKSKVAFLHDGRKVVHMTAAVLAEKFYLDDPITHFGLAEFSSPGTGEFFKDYERGYVMYIFLADRNADPYEYSPAVQVRVPFFYAGSVKFSTCLYNQYRKSSIIDTVQCSEQDLKLGPTSSPDIIAGQVDLLFGAAMKNAPVYTIWLNNLRAFPSRIDEVSAWSNSTDATLRLPNHLLVAIRKHANNLQTSSGTTAPYSPPSITRGYDVLDTLAFCASHHESGNLDKRRVDEIAVFNYFGRTPQGGDVFDAIKKGPRQ